MLADAGGCWRMLADAGASGASSCLDLRFFRILARLSWILWLPSSILFRHGIHSSVRKILGGGRGVGEEEGEGDSSNIYQIII